MAERITQREGECFASMFHDVRSLKAAVTKLPAECVTFDAKLEVHKQNLDVRQVAKKKATREAGIASADAAGASRRE